MKIPIWFYWLASGILACSAMLMLFPSTSQGQHLWFRKPKATVPCPEKPALEPTKEPAKPAPEKKPLDAPPEPLPEPVTTAALGSGQASINMYGDRFGGFSQSTILTGTPRLIRTLGIINQFNVGPFVAPVPPGRLGFIPPNAVPLLPYFISIPGAGPGPVLPNQVILLSDSQPFINKTLTGADPNFQIRNGIATVDSTSAPDSADVQYTEINAVGINVANPGSGGVVGRSKMSEDLNPLPRDRFIFNYDYFNQTPLSTTGVNVNRFVVGIEKTFFDQLASIEVRLPFASTLSSDLVVGAQSMYTELGDLRLMLKALLYSSQAINVAGGLGIYLPTADDVHVYQADGTELVHIQNKAVILTPFIGILLTPNERWFGQMWLACDFDSSGDPVQVINYSFTGLQAAGRLRDQTYMQWDAQVGYWLLQPGRGRGLLQGLAPFVELHYGTTLTNADLIHSNGFVIGNLDNRVDELNISGGFAAVVGDNLLLSVGASAPLRTGSDRSFEYQIGVRASLFFGPTAAQRRAAALVSSF